MQLRRGWVLNAPTRAQPVGRMQRRGGYAFSPTEIAGLAAWYRADAPGTLWQDSARTTPAAAAADPVGAWDDLSGAGNHVTQATAGKRPTYQTNQRAALPAVRFDATDDFLARAFTLNQPVTCLVACRFPILNRMVLDGTTPGARNQFGTFTANTARLHAATSLTSSAVMTHGAWVVLSWVLNGATSEIFKNGTSIGTGACGANQPGGLTLGAHGAQNANFMGSEIGEVLIYTGGLSTTDRQTLEQYLASRWMTSKEPIEVAGCTAWFRGDLANLTTDSAGTIPATAQDDPIGLWATKVSTVHLNQTATSAPDRRPKLQLAAINGKNAVRFDGVDDWLLAGSALSTWLSGTTGVVYCVFKANAFNQMGNESGTNSYQADGLWTEQGARSGVTMTGTTPLLHAYCGETGAAADIDYNRSPIAAGVWRAHRWRHTGGTLYSRLNGEAEISVASGTTSYTSALRLGVNYNASFFASVDIAEWFSFNVDVSPADMASMELYLSQRYLMSG
ncbi:MAG TPA: hypothetical protein VFQ04_04865 [Actinomycetes bacterium]|nr:hypothetical protein [Actinomycetes bacterium]